MNLRPAYPDNEPTNNPSKIIIKESLSIQTLSSKTERNTTIHSMYIPPIKVPFDQPQFFCHADDMNADKNTDSIIDAKAIGEIYSSGKSVIYDAPATTKIIGIVIASETITPLNM